MTLQDAFDWILIHNGAFGDAPGVIGKPESWIMAAGKLCRRAVEKGTKPVTDEDVDKVYKGRPLTENVER